MNRSLLSLSLLVSFGISAAPQVTPDMMAKFKTLPPAQQQALAKQYGLDLNAMGMAQQGSQPFAPTQQIVPTTIPREVNYDQASQRNQLSDSGSLQPFGYNIFSGEPLTDSPALDMPVADDYIVGPGDEIRVQLIGKEEANYSLVVGREGFIDFPSLGQIQANGLTFQQLREELSKRISKQMIGVEAFINFGTLRTMQIFVMGDAYRPGAYNVNGMTTVTQALQAAGGIDTVGSLRKIQVKRAGENVIDVDLYKMLIWGDTSQDVRLRAGDTVFIPAKGSEVTIDGLVKRPAIYELRNQAPISSVLELAGGLKAAAVKEVSVTRYGEEGMRVYNLDLSNGSDRSFTIRDGDNIEVKATTNEYDRAIVVKGAAVREGVFSYQPGTRISQLLRDLNRDIKSTADLDYALVVREVDAQRNIEVLQFNLGRAVMQPGSSDDLALQPRDQILIFDKDANARFETFESQKERNDPFAQQGTNSSNNMMTASGNGGGSSRSRSMSTQTAQQMGTQSNQYLSQQNPTNMQTQQSMGNTTMMGGAATTAGSGMQGMQGNGSQDFALLQKELERAKQDELVQDQVTGAEVKRSQLEELKALGKQREEMTKKTTSMDLVKDSRKALLEPIIERLKLQATQGKPVQIAEVRGEVKFPGIYPIGRNSRMSDLLAAAGGLTEKASTAEVSRLKERSGSIAVENQRFDLSSVTNRSNSPLVISKDSINILANPDWREEATVQIMGEVMYPGTYTVRRGESLRELVERAGGVTPYANPNGTVFAREALRRQEEQRLLLLRDQLKAEISTLSLRRSTGMANYTSTPAEALGVVSQLENTKAIGRMTIDMPALLAGDKQSDVLLENGDKVYVPTLQNVVSVNGMVQLPSTHIYDPKLSMSDYLVKAGGTKKQADEDRIYVLKANGSVDMPGFMSGAKLEPGDAIIVPIDTDYLDNLSVMSSATQILYQIGVAYDAVKE